MDLLSAASLSVVGIVQAWGMKYRVDSLYGHPPGSQVRSLGVTGEGSEAIAVSGAQDGSLVLWRLETGLPLSSRGPTPSSSAYHKAGADGKLRALSLWRDILATGEGSRVKVWAKEDKDTSFDVSSRPLQLEAHSSPVSTVHVSRHGILTGGWDQRVRMWSHDKLLAARPFLEQSGTKSDRRLAIEGASVSFVAEWGYSDWVWRVLEIDKKIVCCTGGFVSVRDIESGRITHAWAGVDDGQVPCCAASCCGQLVFSGSDVSPCPHCEGLSCCLCASVIVTSVCRNCLLHDRMGVLDCGI